MSVTITDEIIDAIIQNEHRHVCRRPRRPAGVPRAPRSIACLKPDWSQLPPDFGDTGACEAAVLLSAFRR
jgi:hypothetical protein